MSRTQVQQASQVVSEEKIDASKNQVGFQVLLGTLLGVKGNHARGRTFQHRESVPRNA
jgi:hypothetical protein